MGSSRPQTRRSRPPDRPTARPPRHEFRRTKELRTTCAFSTGPSTSAQASMPTSRSSGSTSALGELENWPSMRLGRGFTDGLVAALPGLQEHTCSYGEPGGFIRRLTEDQGTWLGHILEHVAIELQNVAGEPVTFGKTRSYGDDGPLSRDLPVRAGGCRARGGAARAHAAALAPAERAQAEGRGAGGVRLRGRAGRVHPLRAAAPPGAEHHGAGAGGRGAEDPLDPAQRAEPHPARPRALPAAGAGHGDEPNPAHLGGAGLGQGGDQPHPGGPRPPGAETAPGTGAGGRRAGGGGDRLSGGGEAVQRQPRPRDHHPRHHGRRGSPGVRRRAGAQPERHHRELHHRRGPPDAGDQRPAHRRLQAGSGPRGGRRSAHDRAAGRGGEQRSAAGHRAREGAHPSHLRPPGRDDDGPEGLLPGRAFPRPASGSSSAPPATSPPAAPPPT